MAINRPEHNGTYVHFHDDTAGDVVVLEYDCGWSPNVIYSGSTILVYAPYSWVPGHRYYVTFDSGILLFSLVFFFFLCIFISGTSSGNDLISVVCISFCQEEEEKVKVCVYVDAESAPITNPIFWVFDIWKPELSSTTSTTTKPPTTHTITTRVNQISIFHFNFVHI